MKEEEGALDNVPKGISFARLVNPDTNAEIIVCGVRHRAQLHSSYVTDLLHEMQPNGVFMQVPPDLPHFIVPKDEQEKDFRGEWYQFLTQGKNSDFFVNPSPKYLNDITLSQKRVESILNSSLRYSSADMQIGSHVIFTAETREDQL